MIKAGKLLPLDTPRPWGDGRKVVAWIAGRIDCAGRKPVTRWDLIVGLDDDVLACRRGELWYGGFGLLVDWGVIESPCDTPRPGGVVAVVARLCGRTDPDRNEAGGE